MTKAEKADPARWAAYMRNWRAQNLERNRAYARKSYRKHVVKRRQAHVLASAKYNARLRAEIIQFFGGHCFHCGTTDPRVLQMDHINGGGHAEREAGKLTLWRRWKLLQTDPEGARRRFQLLCANCNIIKQYEHREYGPGRKPVIPVPPGELDA